MNLLIIQKILSIAYVAIFSAVPTSRPNELRTVLENLETLDSLHTVEGLPAVLVRTSELHLSVSPLKPAAYREIRYTLRLRSLDDYFDVPIWSLFKPDLNGVDTRSTDAIVKAVSWDKAYSVVIYNSGRDSRGTVMVCDAEFKADQGVFSAPFDCGVKVEDFIDGRLRSASIYGHYGDGTLCVKVTNEEEQDFWYVPIIKGKQQKWQRVP